MKDRYLLELPSGLGGVREWGCVIVVTPLFEGRGGGDLNALSEYLLNVRLHFSLVD